jgi:hypothetical protein
MISFKKFLIEQHVLLERPSIEDQIETGNYTILDVGTGKTKGFAQAGQIKIPFDITIDPELSKTSTRGEFRFSGLAANKRLYPELFADTKELKAIMALNPIIKVNDDDVNKALRNQDTVAHEAAHAHQLAAKIRDAETRKAQGKTTYADVEIREIEKALTPQRSSNPKLENISPETKLNLQHSRYYLNPQEVNARSAGAGTVAYRLRSHGADRIFSFEAPKISGEIGLKYVAGGSQISPEQTAAMTRHERSVAKRQNILARKDLRDASARGVLKAEQEMATPNPEAETAKARQAAIKAKVETLKAETEQPKILSPEVTPTKAANVASKIIDPTSAAIQATTSQASKIAPQASLNPLPGTQVKGVKMGMGIGAGIVGGLAGEYLVKPAAEKAGVFDAVEKGTRAALSKMPNWAADVADVGLGAAQVALDPLSAMAPMLQQGLKTKTKQEVDAAIKAGKPSQVRVRGPKI